MNIKLIAKIVMMILILLFMGFSIFGLANAPRLCWDGWDEVNSRPIGGCEPDYSLAIQGLILPFVMFVIFLVVFLILYFKIKK